MEPDRQAAASRAPATEHGSGKAALGSGDGDARVALEQLDERYAELRMSRPGLVSALRRSIEREGLLHALLVNLERDGKLALLDGFKRLRALRALGHEQAEVRIVELDDAAARAAMLAYNTPHRGLCELEQSWVVRSLVRGCGLQQRQVAELLGRHRSWVCRRLALVERLDDVVQQDIRLGLVSATMARELSKLPRGNQAPVALAVRQHGLSSRQCGALVEHALSCRGARALTALLRDPWRRLIQQAERAPARDPRLSQGAEAVRGRLVALERAARWLHESLTEHPLVGLSSDELELLGPLALSASERSSQALSALDELLLGQHTAAS
jgi:ParB-like chromosome segregation protein Spo0J